MAPLGDLDMTEAPERTPFDMLFPHRAGRRASPSSPSPPSLGDRWESIGRWRSRRLEPGSFSNTDASMALFYSVIFTLVLTISTMRCSSSIHAASEAITDGIKSMVPA